ncbi:MAG: glycosyltransferase [Oscillospiraceae bacterium]|nr:glycosyltransferase [Oscillospiraceae bacterium]
MEKIKIALFQNDLGVGGIQKSVVNLLRNIDYERFDVTLYLSQKEDFWDLKFPEQLQVRYLNPTPRIYSFLPFEFGLKRVHYDFPDGVVYDLAGDFNSYQFSCAAGAIKAPARKHVMWIHNDVEIKYRNEWKYRVLWQAFKGKFRHFDGFVAGTASIIEPFQRLSGVTDRDKPFCAIHNFIDVETIRKKMEEVTEDLHLDASCVNFVALGRLCHQKGYDIMLDAFAEACRKRSDLHLYIIGDGDDRTALEQQRDRLGLADRVSFLGSRPNPYCIMKQMDAFISTSRYEGQPLNIMDAMVVGLPLYCTKNLEQYSEGLKGYDDIAAAIAGAQKTEHHPDDLRAYNQKIIDSLVRLAQ